MAVHFGKKIAVMTDFQKVFDCPSYHFLITEFSTYDFNLKSLRLTYICLSNRK